MFCPICRTYNDPALTPSGRTPPKDWDPILCVGCHTILCIDHTAPGMLRAPTVDDWTAWKADPRIGPGIALAIALAANAHQTKKDPDA